mmetsp:Transcript_62057/g.134663  ORF Transcript_62057/g.134663 Transcript_62057/m.134663 type:complete len:222 (+) Transcript_62057:1364-2029(+)
MRRAIRAQLKAAFLRLTVSGEQVVGNDPEFRVGIEDVSAFLDNLHLAGLQHWKPLLDLFLPNPAQSGRADHQHWPLGRVLRCQRQRLHALPQAHLVSEDAPTAPAEAETHTLKLIGQQPGRKPVLSQGVLPQLGATQKAEDPGRHLLDGTEACKLSDHVVIRGHGEEPLLAAGRHPSALESTNRLPDVGRNEGRSATGSFGSNLELLRTQQLAHEVGPFAL